MTKYTGYCAIAGFFAAVAENRPKAERVALSILDHLAALAAATVSSAVVTEEMNCPAPRILKEAVDCIVYADHVVPGQPLGLVFPHAGVAVRGGRIIAISSWEDLDARFDAAVRDRLPSGRALIPGKIILL